MLTEGFVGFVAVATFAGVAIWGLSGLMHFPLLWGQHAAYKGVDELERSAWGRWTGLSLARASSYWIGLEASPRGAQFYVDSAKLSAKAFDRLCFPWELVRLKQAKRRFGTRYYLQVNLEPELQFDIRRRKDYLEIASKIGPQVPWLCEKEQR